MSGKRKKTPNEVKAKLQTCYICNCVKDRQYGTLYETRSKHSEIRISDFIQRILGDVETQRKIDSENEYNPNYVCNDCVEKIDEYDLACVTAERVENVLRTMILQSQQAFLDNQQNSGDHDEIPDQKFHINEFDIKNECLSSQFDDDLIEMDNKFEVERFEMESNEEVESDAEDSTQEAYESHTMKSNLNYLMN